MAHGPASTTRSRGSSGGAWNESAERKATIGSLSWAKLTRRAWPSAPASAVTVLVVPKSIPIAGPPMNLIPNAERAGARFGAPASAHFREVAPDEGLIELCQLPDLGNWDSFVDAVHRGADEAELDDGAERADEAGVRCAAGCGELRPPAGHLLGGAGDEVGEGPRFGEERLAADVDGDADVAPEAFAGPRRLALDPVRE